MRLEMMARRHWEKTRPKETEQMKKLGTFDQEMKERAEQAIKEAVAMVARGAPRAMAMEIVEAEYILIPPETM